MKGVRSGIVREEREAIGFCRKVINLKRRRYAASPLNRAIGETGVFYRDGTTIRKCRTSNRELIFNRF